MPTKGDEDCSGFSSAMFPSLGRLSPIGLPWERFVDDVKQMLRLSASARYHVPTIALPD